MCFKKNESFAKLCTFVSVHVIKVCTFVSVHVRCPTCYRLAKVQISFKIFTCNVLVYMCTSLYISTCTKECVQTGCISVYISTCTERCSPFLPYILSTLKNSSCEDKTKKECV